MTEMPITEMQDTQPLPALHAGQVDITPMLGEWINTHDATRWIRKFILAKKGDAFTVRPFFVDEPSDWGETEITTYRDNTGEPGFHAAFEVGSIKAVFAANTNKGLVIIVAFYQFLDGSGRENVLSREFYFHGPSSI